MSNIATAAAVVNLPSGIVLPATASIVQTRQAAKKLMQLAGESALASGKVTPEQTYAFGLGLALLAGADNQSAPLQRVQAFIGGKPNKSQAARLQYWINCTAAGKAAWKNEAEELNIAALVMHESVSEFSATALAALADKAKEAAAAALLMEANTKRVADIEAAAAAAGKAAAARIEAAAAAIHAEAYTEAAAHGNHMESRYIDLGYFASIQAEKAAALAASEKAAALASKTAWLEAAAAATVADVMTNKAKAAAAFSSLAAALGLTLSNDQKAALVKLVSEQGQAAAFSAERAEAAASAKAEAAALSEQAAAVKVVAASRRKAKAA